ncbi:acetyl-CoA hydrolase/transferase family protein [Terrabacter carboxydivorans]|uniref:Acetyl-CoA hydrolase/transferase C-terminal domain-containing protein n=1 Tax=Terrabacter carboxydivorans TaxID=619730 RepID=A0ABP5XZ45_9MICO
MTPITAAAAIAEHVKPGDTVVISPGMGEPASLVAELASQAERLKGSRILCGLLLDEYPFASDEALRHLTFDTWHTMAPIRDAVASGRVGFFPIRGGRVVDHLLRTGVDVLLCSVSEADRFGFHSFGPSVSYPLPIAQMARKVVAEVHPEFPYTCGETVLHLDRIAALVEAPGPGRSYREAVLTEEAKQIAVHVRELIPDHATLQVGIGAVSEALLKALLEQGSPDDLRFWGMGIDSMVDLYQQSGVGRRQGRPFLVGAELMGSTRLLEFADRNPDVTLYPSAVVLSPQSIAQVPNFVSVNTALEVDLCGAVNAEVLRGRQISGAGGSFDFIEGATMSEGGISVIAISSTAGDGKFSRIVPQLNGPATVPRHSVQYVVTEYGIAELAGKTLGQRAESLISIAHPSHRDQLEATRTAKSWGGALA